jgi:glutamine---fructose-6-phosphate transaminase (isomerizing)
MCGIVGYIGTEKRAKEILLKGLLDLEYRGYDSAGVKLGSVPVQKVTGPVKNLEEVCQSVPENSTIGIGHTRWATHGVPAEKNAHPHSGEKGVVWIVHNGIVENYQSLKKELQKNGVHFTSDTDSEVIAHLIEKEHLAGASLLDAVNTALGNIQGTYGLVVFSENEPEHLILARMGSPIVCGVTKDACIIASDAVPVLKHTNSVVYLEDGELMVVGAGEYEIYNADRAIVTKTPTTLAWSVESAQKEGHDHFMIKEILEIPEVIENTVRGRIQEKEGLVKLGGLESVAEKLRDITRLHIVGCGSAYYAGLYGKYVLEEYAGLPVSVEQASEFRYRKPVLEKGSAMLVISQSGETADTLEAMREARRQGVLCLGVVNAVGATIARETDAGVYNHAGPEISVASTKAFVSQVVVMVLLSVFLGRMRGMSLGEATALLHGLKKLPDVVRNITKEKTSIEHLAKKYAHIENAIFIGRNYCMPISLEGALKLKEVSYIHAEGYPAGELKHGPLALVDKDMVVVALAPDDLVHEKMLSNISEVEARNGQVLIVSDAEGAAKGFPPLPNITQPLQAIAHLIPLQLFAYYIAVAKGFDVDRPRNLAKSVTVE